MARIQRSCGVRFLLLRKGRFLRVDIRLLSLEYPTLAVTLNRAGNDGGVDDFCLSVVFQVPFRMWLVGRWLMQTWYFDNAVSLLHRIVGSVRKSGGQCVVKV